MPWEKLAKWFVFSVLLALLPFAFNYLKLETRGEAANLRALLGNGELLLAAAAISAAAVGDVIGSGKDRGLSKIFAAGGAVLILALASMQFADITSAQALPGFHRDVVVGASEFFFCCSIAAGAGCIALGGK